MRLWQVASGDSGRDYSGLFLRHDVMLIGPGEPGEFNEARYPGKGMAPQIRAFARKPRPGDIVLLRNGHEVIAAGRIPSSEEDGYTWNPAFDDVLGWDLQHTRRVIWSEDAAKVLSPQQPVFANYKQQRTFTEVHEPRLKSVISQIDEAIVRRELRALGSP